MEVLYKQLVAQRGGEPLKDGSTPLSFADAAKLSQGERFSAARKYAARLGLRTSQAMGHVFVNGRYSAVDQVSSPCASPSGQLSFQQTLRSHLQSTLTLQQQYMQQPARRHGGLGTGGGLALGAGGGLLGGMLLGEAMDGGDGGGTFTLLRIYVT